MPETNKQLIPPDRLTPVDYSGNAEHSHGDKHLDEENICPDCRLQMVRLGYCFSCPHCGFGGCQ